MSSVVEDAYQEVLTEDVADLLEEIEVENPAVNIEETRNTNAENELLYENSRITVGESLLLIMAFIMRHKLSLVASEDLISLVELHCPGQNNALKGLSRFREFFQSLKHPMKKQFSCPNPKCIYIYLLPNHKVVMFARYARSRYREVLFFRTSCRRTAENCSFT